MFSKEAQWHLPTLGWQSHQGSQLRLDQRKLASLWFWYLDFFLQSNPDKQRNIVQQIWNLLTLASASLAPSTSGQQLISKRVRRVKGNITRFETKSGLFSWFDQTVVGKPCGHHPSELRWSRAITQLLARPSLFSSQCFFGMQFVWKNIRKYYTFEEVQEF